jgi:hypothetical protein
MDVPIEENGKRLIVPNNKVVTSTLEVVATNDHEPVEVVLTPSTSCQGGVLPD